MLHPNLGVNYNAPAKPLAGVDELLAALGVALIRTLLFRCGPADIIQAVIVVIHDPVQAHAGRAWAKPAFDVIHEDAEIMPALAYLDAPATVILVIIIGWVFATCNHATPWSLHVVR